MKYKVKIILLYQMTDYVIIIKAICNCYKLECKNMK